MKRFILYLFIYLPALTVQEDCKTFVNSIWTQAFFPDTTNQTSEQKWYFQYSGRNGMFDLGQRNDCEDNPAMKYYVLAKLYMLPLSKTGAYYPSETAVCLPAFCSKQGLIDDHETLIKLFNANNFHVKLNSNVTVYDPNEAPPRGIGFYILAVFISSLSAFCILSTLLVLRMKKLPNEDTQQGTLGKYLWVFKAFDIHENAKSLYLTARELGQSEQISTFGFIRFLSAVWIIIYHNWLLNIFKRTSSAPHARPNELVKSGLLAVEYFFFIGGFLAAYVLTVKAFKEGVGIRRYVSDIFHRWVRVWPSLILAIAVYWFGVVCLMNGSLWGRFVGVVKICDQTWWQKILMIDNYFPQPGNYCASYTWYIDVDFQIYCAVVAVVYLFVKRRYLGYLASFGLIIASILYGIHIYKTGLDQGISSFDAWYVKAISRSFEVMIGVIFGFQFYDYVKHKHSINFFTFCEKRRYLSYPLILVGLFLNYFSIYHREPVGNSARAIWNVLERLMVCVGSAFVFLPLAHGTIPFFQKFMNLRIFQILGKLSFGAYLFHWPIMLALIYSPLHFPDSYSESQILIRSLKTCLIVFGVSVPYYLFFEKPIINIESRFMKKSKPILKSKQDLELANQQQSYDEEPQDAPIAEVIKDRVVLIDERFEPSSTFPQINQPLSH